MKTSPRKAIASYCKSCIYDSKCSGSWRAQVEQCTILTCELYDHRPLSLQTSRLQKESHLASLAPAEQEIALKLRSQRAISMQNVHDRVMQ